jgi:hypothetical protein
MLAAADLTHIFANAESDGSDIVVSTASGTELPVEVVDWDTSNSEFEIWFRADTLDADGDNSFLIQYGGNGSSLASTQVWADYNGSGTDWSLVMHFQNNCNDSSPSANNGTFSGTAAVSYVDGDYGRAIDLDGIDQHVQVPHAANLAGGDGVDDNPLTMLFRITADDWTYFRAVSKGIANGTRDYIMGSNSGDFLSLLVTDGGAANREGRQYGSALTTDQGSEHCYASRYTGVGGGSAANGISVLRDAIVVDDTDASAGSYAAMNGDSDVLAIGRYDTSYADGKIAHVRLIQLDLGNQAVALHQQNEMSPEGFAMAGSYGETPANMQIPGIPTTDIPFGAF